MLRLSRLLACALALLFSASGCGRPSSPASEDGQKSKTLADPPPADSSPFVANPHSLTSEPEAVVPGAESRSFSAPFRDEFARADPALDGWDTEVFQDKASAVLANLLAVFPKAAEDPELLAPYLAPAIQTAPLRPALSEVFRDHSLVVRRSTSPRETSTSQGAAALAAAVAGLLEPWQNHATPRLSKKLYTVEPAEDGVVTRVLFEAFGPVESHALQFNAAWKLLWSKDDPPLLRSISVESCEEIETVPGLPSLFSDCTEAVFAGGEAFTSHLIHGVDHWRHRLERTLAPGITAASGLALGDLNGDGWDDVYLCQPHNLPDRLLIRQPDGSVVDRAAASGLDRRDPSSSALILDFDNDGDQDLAVAGEGGVWFFENTGALAFEPRGSSPFSSNVESMAAADYDLDGFLDLYLCGHTPSTKEQQESVLGIPIPIYDARNGQPNVLLRNEGDWRFRDVTKATGLDVHNDRFTYAAAWEDFDNDGDSDLYVANDFGRNNLYRNDGGSFTDVASEAGVEDISSGMSVSWSDYNLDGHMDVYVGNMFSSAGNRVAYQRQFRSGADAAELENIRRMARGNSLFENRGDKTFADVSVERGVTMGRWSWASRFTDFNNDGREDIAIVNGFVTNSIAEDL